MVNRNSRRVFGQLPGEIENVRPQLVNENGVQLQIAQALSKMKKRLLEHYSEYIYNKTSVIRREECEKFETGVCNSDFNFFYV